MHQYLNKVAPSPLYTPLIPFVLRRSLVIWRADLGASTEVPYVRRFMLAAATPLPALDRTWLAVHKFKEKVRIGISNKSIKFQVI